MTRALDDRELLALADVLADGGWHSGETLAIAAGISRAALAKRVAHLIEDWDLDIEARAGLGYRLAVPLERLDGALIASGLDRETRARLRSLDMAMRVDSTNQRLLEAVADGDPQALFAEAQSAGRGRRGRSWRSPFGANLMFSLAWSFPSWPPSLGTLPLAIGVTCAQTLAASGVRGVGLKWPNDLRIGNAKLGGILVEQRGEAGGACRVVIGIGINVAMTPAQACDLGQAWTSVHAEMPGVALVSRNTLASRLLDSLVTALTAFEHRGFAPFAAEWSALDVSAGREVRIEGAGAPLEGTACGIDERGALIVRTGNGDVHHLHAGEVSLRLEPRTTVGA